MATISIDLTDNSQEIREAMRQQAIKGLEVCGLLGEGYAKVNITEVKAVDTGNLRNSITHQVDEQELAVYIGTNVEYAPYIEFGTGEFAETGGRQTPWTYQDADGNWYMTTGMQPRPYLRPAINDNIDTYKQAIEDALRGE